MKKRAWGPVVVSLVLAVALSFACGACGASELWNLDYLALKKLTHSGTTTLGASLDEAAAVTDNGDGTVRFASAGHGFSVGDKIYISGTTAYDGYYPVSAVPSNQAFDVTATHVAINTESSDTAKVVIDPGEDFRLVSLRMTCDVVPATSENLVVSLDAASGVSYDQEVYSVDLSAAASTTKTWGTDGPLFFSSGDKLIFTWPNSDGRRYGLEVRYGVKR